MPEISRPAMRRVARAAGGGVLVGVGVVLLVTPGPGLPLIFVGLRLLGVGSS